MIATVASVVAQAVILRRELGGIELGRFIGTSIRVTIAAAALAAAAYVVWSGLDTALGREHRRPDRLARRRPAGRRGHLRRRGHAAAGAGGRADLAAWCGAGMLRVSPGDPGRPRRQAGGLLRAGRGAGGGRRLIPTLGLAHGPDPQLLDHRPHRPRQVDARRPHPRAHRARSTRARTCRRCSTRWTSSASAGSRSRRRRCGSPTGAADGETYHLHLIDTPGHVDFSYEVSRSLAACEGALLVVDAAQGVEAQTVANAYAAVDAGLELIPVLNKVDLPGADPDGVAAQVADLLGGDPAEALRISAKTGEGVREVLEAIVERDPAARGRAGRAAAGADLRLRVRPVPRRRRLRADGGRRASPRASRSRRCRPARGRHRRHRLLHAGDDAGRRDGGGRGRLRDHRDQGRHQAPRRRHADQPRAPRRRGAARLPRGAADGLLRALPDRHRPLRGPARRPRPPRAQRRRPLLRARDLRRARLRLPLRLPRPAAHGHRPRAPRARVRPRAARDHPQRPLRGDADQHGRGGRGPQPDRDARPRLDRVDRRAVHPGHDHHPERLRRRR